MLFKEIIGQEVIKDRLVNLVGQNRLSHALLFLGKEGCGALPLAIALAQYLVCEKISFALTRKEDGQSLFETQFPTADLQPRNDSCGSCPACQKAQLLIHPDIHCSYPVIPRKSGDKPISTDYVKEWREFIKQYPYGNVYDWLQFIGAENKQGNITAEECNDIIRKLNLKSFESGYKILLIWMPEYLGKEGNKLLKLMEEPPANTLFILVAGDENLILPTIVSRTQLVKIPALETIEIENALVERAKISKDQSRQISSVSDGSYREALQVMQHAEEDWQSLLRDWLNAILRTGPIAQVRWVEEISKLGREKQKQFLRYFNHLIEHAIRVRIAGGDANNSRIAGGDANNSRIAGGDANNSRIVGGDANNSRIAGSGDKGTDINGISGFNSHEDFAARINNISSLSQQAAIIEEIDKATYYIERNANAKMLFLALSFKLYHIFTEQTVPTVKYY